MAVGDSLFLHPTRSRCNQHYQSRDEATTVSHRGVLLLSWYNPPELCDGGASCAFDAQPFPDLGIGGPTTARSMKEMVIE